MIFMPRLISIERVDLMDWRIVYRRWGRTHTIQGNHVWRYWPCGTRVPWGLGEWAQDRLEGERMRLREVRK